MLWKCNINRVDTFGAMHASIWVGATVQIQVSRPFKAMRLTLLEHSMAICNNENFSLSLSVQLCRKQHFDWSLSMNMVNLCQSNVTPKSLCSYIASPLRFAYDPCQHTLRTGSTIDHQSVSFGSWCSNGAVNFNEIWHRLSSPVRFSMWLISRCSITYINVRSTV